MARADRKPRSYARTLVTPEGVALSIELARGSVRAGAFLIDVTIIILAMIAMLLVLTYGLGATGGSSAILIAMLLLYFVGRNLYFLLFEAGPRAATPGKRLLGLRVVSRDGTGLSLDQVIARNLMRELEIFLPLAMIFIPSADPLDGASKLAGFAWAVLFTLFPLFNRDRLRIGDLLAGTGVVQAPRRTLLPELVAERETDFTSAQLDVYGIAELHRLEDLLRAGNDETLARVAGTIAWKIGWEQPINDSRDFLTRYYAGTRAHLERRVLLGRRRRDKFDT